MRRWMLASPDDSHVYLKRFHKRTTSRCDNFFEMSKRSKKRKQFQKPVWVWSNQQNKDVSVHVRMEIAIVTITWTRNQFNEWLRRFPERLLQRISNIPILSRQCLWQVVRHVRKLDQFDSKFNSIQNV